MQRQVVVGCAVVVLVERLAVAADQNRTERGVSLVQCDAGQFDATTQAFHIDLADHHSRSLRVDYPAPANVWAVLIA
jgi:hypothetical protein